MMSNFQKNVHLLSRATFGVCPAYLSELIDRKPDQYFANNLHESLVSEKELALDILDKPSFFQKEQLKIDSSSTAIDIKKTSSTDTTQTTIDPSKLIKRDFVHYSKEQTKLLTTLWMEKMVFSPAQLLEKMTLFWHGHFACRTLNASYALSLLNTIRKNALGNFGDLLRAVSKEPAMLDFLNNKQNKKQHPNENFAREVLELFTLGYGHYSEQDIKEAARAFTGWSYNDKGQFQLNLKQHDDTIKVFKEQTGNFNGDDIIDIILKQKQTAIHITEKIYRYFVNTTVNADHIEQISNDFYNSGYALSSLVESIFTSTWFYDANNHGVLIKSPVELIVGFRRLLNINLKNPEVQIPLQQAMGQLLFYPPNVAGWPGGQSWIDSSSLLLRMRMPEFFLQKEELSLLTKYNDDIDMGHERVQQLPGGKKFLFESSIDWDRIINDFKMFKDKTDFKYLEQLIWRMPSSTNIQEIVPDEIVKSTLKKDNSLTTFQSAIIALTTTPIYQLS